MKITPLIPLSIKSETPPTSDDIHTVPEAIDSIILTEYLHFEVKHEISVADKVLSISVLHEVNNMS